MLFQLLFSGLYPRINLNAIDGCIDCSWSCTNHLICDVETVLLKTDNVKSLTYLLTRLQSMVHHTRFFTFYLDHGVMLTQIVSQYPSYHVTYEPVKFLCPMV